MSNISLSIKNFGPIRIANIETKRYNFFIGRTSSGKSVAAKLITISNEFDFRTIQDDDFEAFVKMLGKYNIDFKFKDDTEIKIKENDKYWIIKKDVFKTNNKSEDFIELKKANNKELLDQFKSFLASGSTLVNEFTNSILTLLSSGDIDKSKLSKEQVEYLRLILWGAFKGFIYDPIYIPSERILLSIMKNSVFTLLHSGGSVPESIVKFGSRYEQAKSKIKDLDMDFMDVRVSFSKDEDKILLKDLTEVDFLHASSGLQSIIPLWTVLQNELSQDMYHPFIVVEEPELNLFPIQQVALIREIISKMHNTKSSIVFTTHSPYILSVVDNMILADDIYKKAKGNKKKQTEITNIVSKKEFIPFKDIASYGFNDDGTVVDIRDIENHLTGAISIDQASNETSRIFSKLLDIEDEL